VKSTSRPLFREKIINRKTVNKQVYVIATAVVVVMVVV
jgi:hypothetical protein